MKALYFFQSFPAFQFGKLPLGHLLFKSWFFYFLFHFCTLPFWVPSIQVVLSFSRLPYRLSSIQVVFILCHQVCFLKACHPLRSPSSYHLLFSLSPSNVIFYLSNLMLQSPSFSFQAVLHLGCPMLQLSTFQVVFILEESTFVTFPLNILLFQNKTFRALY